MLSLIKYPNGLSIPWFDTPADSGGPNEPFVSIYLQGLLVLRLFPTLIWEPHKY